MTHFKVYIIPEKLYTVAYFDEADKLYYICGCSTGYRPEQVIISQVIVMPDELLACQVCDKKDTSYCSICDDFNLFENKEMLKPLKTK